MDYHEYRYKNVYINTDISANKELGSHECGETLWSTVESDHCSSVS